MKGIQKQTTYCRKTSQEIDHGTKLVGEERKTKMRLMAWEKFEDSEQMRVTIEEVIVNKWEFGF